MYKFSFFYKGSIIVFALLILFIGEMSFSDSSLQIWKKAKKLLSEGKFEEAEKIYEELLIHYPTDPNIIMGSGYLKYYQGKMVLKNGDFKKANELFTEAKKMFDTATNIGGSDIDSKAYFNKGNCDLVLADFLVNSTQPSGSVNIADVFKNAITSFRKAIELNPEFTDAKNNLDYALYKWKQYLISQKKKDQQKENDSSKKAIFSSFIEAITELPEKDVQIDPKKSNVLTLEDKNQYEDKK